MSILKRKPNINNPERSDSDWDALDKATRKSGRNHWMVASFVMAALLGGSLAERRFMEPKLIKELVPVAYDQQTGVYQQLVRLDSDEVISPSESLTRGDLAAFVKARESYDYYNLNEPKDQVRSMATGDVADDYNKLYFGQKPLQDTLKDNVRIIIDVTYVSPTGGATRSVNFTKTMHAGGKVTPTYHVATITFEYDNGVDLDLPLRLLNPLGMQIYYYKVETDLAASS